MNVGRMIFYDKTTGQIIVNTGEWESVKISKTVEQQIETFKVLSERNRDTFDVLELPYSAYAKDFREARLIGVDLEQKIPIFEYPNPENPDVPIVSDKPLSVEIAELKQENILLKAQNKALTDRTDFHEEVLTEIILSINP